MTNVRLLVGVYLKSMLSMNRLRYSKKSSDRRKRTFMLAGSPLVLLLLMAIAGVYCVAMAVALQATGGLEAMPVTMFTLSGAFTLFSCIYKGGEMLLGFKDYDLQVAMPVSLTEIAVSRLIIQYITSMLMVLLIMIPAGGVYAYFASPDWTFYPMYIVSMLALPLLPAVIGSVIGALISRLAAMFRKSRYVNLIFTFAVFGAYLYLVFSLSSDSGEAFGRIATTVSSSVTRVYPPARLFAGVLAGSFSDFAIFTLGSLAAFLLVAVFFTKNIRTLHDRVMAKVAHRKFKMKTLRVSSPLKSLYKREFSRYFASTIYVMNTAFGTVMAVILAVAALIAGRETVLGLFPEQNGVSMIDLLTGIMPFALGFLASSCCTTGSSISLEGRQVWITQSLPVRAMDVFNSKMLVNMAVMAPSVIIAPAAMCYIFTPDLLTALSWFIVPIAYGLAICVFGLWLNLRSHRFDWKNETQIVKQSMAAGVPIFVAMLLSFGGGIAASAAGEYALLTTYGLALLSLAIAAAFYFTVRKNAEKELRSL